MTRAADLADTLAAQCAAVGLPEATRELRFHPTRRWRFDLGYPTRMIAAECDGGVWARSRHTTGRGFTDDCHKLNAATLLGWRVYRFTADMVYNGTALAVLEQALGVGNE